MSSISYTTPPYNHSYETFDNAFIQPFVDNMILAGATRSALPYTTVTDSYSTKPAVDWSNTFTLPPLNASNGLGSSQYLFSLCFDMPVGNNSVIHTDHPNYPGFKKITESSYDDTPIKIIFEFKHLNTSGSGYSVWKYLICDTLIRSESGLYTNYSRPGYNYATTSGSTIATYDIKGKSYISITKNSISIVMGCHSLTNLGPSNHNLDFYRYMINIHLYREDGNFYLYGQSGFIANTVSKTTHYIGPSAADLKMQSYVKESNLISTYLNDTNFIFWPFSTTPSVVAGQTVNYKFYGFQINNKIEQCSQFIATKLNGASTSEIDISYKYGDQYIVSNYVNLGATERSLMIYFGSAGLLYSIGFLHDETIVYDSNLGEEL